MGFLFAQLRRFSPLLAVAPLGVIAVACNFSQAINGTAGISLQNFGATSTPTPSSASSISTAVVVAPTPDMTGVPASTLFKVQVTQAGIAAQKFVYVSRAATTQGANHSNGWWDGQLGKTFNYSIFSGAGPFTIQVTKLGSAATAATIRPTRLGLGTVTAVRSSAGSTVTFTLSAPAPISIEFNDDTPMNDAMVIMAQPLESTANVPSATASNVYSLPAGSTALNIPTGKTVVYFQPGVHHIDTWVIPATITQVYFAENSFVYGLISSNPAGRPAIKINGRGVFSGDGHAYASSTYLLQLGNASWNYTSTGNLLEGIALVDAPEYTSQFMASNSTVEHILFHGFQVQNDGLHLVGSNNTIQNNFFHVNDDNVCLSIPADNNVFTNNVFWGLLSGSTFDIDYLIHSITNLTITHSDLIHADWISGLSYTTGGFLQTLNATTNANSTNSLIQGVTISDLQVESPVLRLFDTRMLHSGNNQALSFKDFTLTDIHLDHQGSLSAADPLLLFDAADSTHTITNFQFTNFTINGTTITQSAATSNNGIMLLNGPVNTPTFH